MKLLKIVKYVDKMELLSGLSIKGANNELNIGGVDSEVIKNPITKMPYIPGSSLKGKMRSLLELKYGKLGKSGEENASTPCGCGKKDCFVCTIFGAHMNTKAESAPTRIIVRDCNLAEESIELIEKLPLDNGNFLETKYENSIDRGNGKAKSPRIIERVPAGLKFDVNIVLQIFEGDDEEAMKAKVDEALNLLENSYLGGSGSRGYGCVRFEKKGQWE